MPKVETAGEPNSLVQPSAGERANGWSAERLTAYLQQRRHEEARGLAGIGGAGPRLQPSRCDVAYCPWTW